MKKKKYFEPELDVCRLVFAQVMAVTTTDYDEGDQGEVNPNDPTEEIPE